MIELPVQNWSSSGVSRLSPVEDQLMRSTRKRAFWPVGRVQESLIGEDGSPECLPLL